MTARPTRIRIEHWLGDQAIYLGAQPSWVPAHAGRSALASRGTDRVRDCLPRGRAGVRRTGASWKDAERQRLYRARLKAAREFDEGYSPPEWDGQTQYSDVTESVTLYVAACLSCGREQGEPVRLTRRQSVLVARVGLPRCTTCHGCVLLEDHTVGSIGSPQYGYSASYASLARAWGKGAA